MENKIICMRGHAKRHREVKDFFEKQNVINYRELKFSHPNLIYYIDVALNTVRNVNVDSKYAHMLLPHLTELPLLEEKVEEVEFCLKPFDKVVVRDEEGLWECNKFSHKVKEEGCQYTFNCLGNNWECCLPFNAETEKLIGTYDNPKTKYIFKGVKSCFDEE